MNQIYDCTQGKFKDSTNNIFPGSKEEFIENISISGSDIDYIGNYTFVLPDSLNIFKHYDNINKIKSENVKNQAIYFLLIFRNLLLSLKDKINFSGSLPPLSIETNKEGSLFIEWIFKDFRMVFTFEENEDESSWFFVSNKKYDNLNYSGSINRNNIYDILIYFLSFVVKNV